MSLVVPGGIDAAIRAALGGHQFQADRLWRHAELAETACEFRSGSRARTERRTHAQRKAIIEEGRDCWLAEQAHFRGAWDHGLAAYQAGVSYHANPYQASKGARRGFQPGYEWAWDAGWAWGEWTESDEAVLIAISGASRNFFTRYFLWADVVRKFNS